MSFIMGAMLCAAALSFDSTAVAGIKDHLVYYSEGIAIVAVIPEPTQSYKEKRARLSKAAESFSRLLGCPVILTEDAVAYASVRRVLARGRAKDREGLLRRMEKIKAECYYSG